MTAPTAIGATRAADRPALDRRSQRTRAAILEAFAQIMLRDGFDAITPSRLAEAANVGRSTFYEHFANVEEVLAFSVARLLEPLARAAMLAEMNPGVVTIVQHFWDNRRIARSMFGSTGQVVMQRLFTDQFEAALAELRTLLGINTPLAPPRLTAAYLASGALTLLGAWLTGQASGSAAQIAQTLHAAGYATARALSAEAA